jgi:hypothetical protein
MITYCRYLLVLMIASSLQVQAQERTIIEFYTEVPAVSDFVVEVKTQSSSSVEVRSEGWKIPPGQQVKVEFPYIPPGKMIEEVRLSFIWEAQVLTGTFEGWATGKFRYRVFEEVIYAYENQKRIYPFMAGRNFEFRVRCNTNLRQDRAGLVLQSLIIYWANIPQAE